MKKITGIIAVTLLLLVCLIGNSQSINDKESIKKLIDKVNSYQLKNPWKEFDDIWIRGT